jgi:chromosome segregation ATPase
MEEMNQAAQEIDRVIVVINEIAEQTKLLALNATIEAARAGEAGKGFAVVANEVKDLAAQTNQATLEIREKIGAMQASTEKAVTKIRNINHVIHEVEDVIGSIATAVEEQTATTRDVASNIQNGVGAVQTISKEVDNAASQVSVFAQEVRGVEKAATDVADANANVSWCAEELSKMSETLKQSLTNIRTDDANHANLERKNCWEILNCQRQAGGAKANELGICPAASETQYQNSNGGKNAGRYCWKVAGTLCGGKQQGAHASKLKKCLSCDFYLKVRDEEGEEFTI